MNFKKGLIMAGVGLALAFGAVSGASASPWGFHHPRRVEVNQRLHNQDLRINREYRHGEISLRRARFLHGEDRLVRHEERFDARFDRSHLTRGEYRTLNHQENRINHQIGR